MLILSRASRNTEETKTASKSRVYIVSDDDVELDDLYNIGIESTCKDASRLVNKGINLSIDKYMGINERTL